MASGWKYIGGGLLTGVGEGLKAEAKGTQARNAARQALLDQMSVREKEHKYRTEELVQRGTIAVAGADKKYERDLEIQEIKVEDRAKEIIDYIEVGGESVGRTRGGKIVRTGLKGVKSKKDKDTANVREARVLVEEGVEPDFDTAYARVRQRSTTDEATMRSKALDWASKVEDDFQRQKYNTPEEVSGAMEAYMLFTQGKLSEARTKLASIDPDAGKPENEKNWWVSMWESQTADDRPAHSGSRVGDKPQPAAVPQATAQPAAAQSATVAMPQQQPAGNMQPPPGTGSQAAPYLAATNDHVQWFKQNGRPGEYIQLPDGRVFEK